MPRARSRTVAADPGLLGFLGRSPVAIVECAVDGTIETASPAALRLLSPCARNGRVANLFDVLQPYAPQLRSLSERKGQATGPICEDLRVEVDVRRPASRPSTSTISVGLFKPDPDSVIAVLAEVTPKGRRGARDRAAAREVISTLTSTLDNALSMLNVAITREDFGTGRIFPDRRTLAWLGIEEAADGIALEQVLNRIVDEDREAFLEDRRRALAGEATSFRDFRVRRQDGSIAVIAGRRLVIRDDDGRPVSIVSLGIDVTEQRRAESALQAQRIAEQANRDKTAFLSLMGHEIRTPLGAIIGLADVLRGDVVDPLSSRQRARVEHIAEAGGHLLRLIDDLMDASRIEMGVLRLRIETVDVLPVIHGAMRDVDAPALGRAVQLRFELPEEPVLVRADPTRLKQVLLNLLTNAIKYNREAGSVTVRVQRRGGTCRISVIDTGIGMSAAQQAELFKPFDRLGRDDSEIQGVGIGLVITRGLVEAMEGRIIVESEVREGSAFHVELPVAAPAIPGDDVPGDDNKGS
ncbi:MAG TPA: PAS domain-containing sensor histidine kinase [Burkholderiaceae bacterium]|nr:PAS domain-containing sensor histidine kinase [Burkholderiaceae bacterium]